MMTLAKRKVLLVVHPTNPKAVVSASELSLLLISRGFLVVTNSPHEIAGASTFGSVAELEIAVVFGGDGTILRAAELVRESEVPILGINLGNVGFLAEVSRPSITSIADAIEAGNYRTESRLLLRYEVLRDQKVIESGWALNEVAIERNNTQMVQLFLQIDGRPLSRWGCDGVICATPTGSTAYAFSAGGPVVWPEVNALVLLPLAAHALFSRPMVVSPDSEIAIDLETDEALLLADGMRKMSLRQHDRIVLTKDSKRVQLTHIEDALFTDRLVAKFKLPIEGWRGE